MSRWLVICINVWMVMIAGLLVWFARDAVEYALCFMALVILVAELRGESLFERRKS